MMKQLTLRGFDEEVAREIERVAREEGLSLNRSVQRILRRGVVLMAHEDDRVVGNSLDHLIGTWSAKEADELEQAVADFGVIDQAIWE